MISGSRWKFLNTTPTRKPLPKKVSTTFGPSGLLNGVLIVLSVENSPCWRRKLRHVPLAAAAMTLIHIRATWLAAVGTGHQSHPWPGKSIGNIAGQAKTNSSNHPAEPHIFRKANHFSIFINSPGKKYSQYYRRQHY